MPYMRLTSLKLYLLRLNVNMQWNDVSVIKHIVSLSYPGANLPCCTLFSTGNASFLLGNASFSTGNIVHDARQNTEDRRKLTSPRRTRSARSFLLITAYFFVASVNFVVTIQLRRIYSWPQRTPSYSSNSLLNYLTSFRNYYTLLITSCWSISLPKSFARWPMDS